MQPPPGSGTTALMNARIPRILFVAVLPALTSCQNPPVKGPIDGGRALAHVRNLVAFGPRPSGSKALIQTRDYLLGVLRKAKIKAGIDSFTDPERAKGLRFHNVWAEIPGTRSKEDRLLVLGSHYDSKLCRGHPLPEQNFRFVGANDGGSSSGLLLEIALWLEQNPLPIPVLCVWFDGEESLEFDWNENRALFGSKRCVKWLRARFPKERSLASCVPVMILLDMVGAKDLSISLDLNSDRELISIVAKNARALGFEKHFFKGKVSVTDDHIPFLNYSIRVLDLIQFGDETSGPPSWWHTPDDDLDILSERSLAIVGNVLVASLPEIVKRFYK